MSDDYSLRESLRGLLLIKKMRYLLLTLLLFFCGFSASGQTKPNDFTEVTTVDTSSFELYSQKGDNPRRASLWTIKKFMDQTMSLSGDTLTLTNSNGDVSIDLSAYRDSLYISGDTLYYGGGQFVDLDPYDQSISIDTSTSILSLANGGTADLSFLKEQAVKSLGDLPVADVRDSTNVIMYYDSIGATWVPAHLRLKNGVLSYGQDGGGLDYIEFKPYIPNGENLGSGQAVYKDRSFDNTNGEFDLQFKGIRSGAGIVITSDATDIIISASSIDTASAGNQLVDTLDLVSNNLRISLSSDSIPASSVDLSSLEEVVDGTTLTGAGTSGSPFKNNWTIPYSNTTIGPSYRGFLQRGGSNTTNLPVNQDDGTFYYMACVDNCTQLRIAPGTGETIEDATDTLTLSVGQAYIFQYDNDDNDWAIIASHQVYTNMSSPTIDSDGANKGYVDDHMLAATITDIPTTVNEGTVLFGESGEQWIVTGSSASGFTSDDTFQRTLVGGTKYVIQQGDLILPSNYVTTGTVDSATQVQNTTRLLAAFNAAIALDRTLIIPNDVIQTRSQGTNHFFNITQNATNGNRRLRIKGSGVKSEIEVTSLESSNTSMNIFNFGKDMELDIKDLIISGPDTLFAPKRTGTYSISAGSDTLTYVSGQNFATITVNSIDDAVVGRYITLAGAGPSGDTLRLYVSSKISDTQVILSDTASTTVSGAGGSWYGRWDQKLQQNLVFNHTGNTYEQMGSGKSITLYAGQKNITATGFTWPTDIENGFLYVYDTTTQNRIALRIMRRVSDTEAIINTEFNEEFDYKYVANTSNTYYQTNSNISFDNVILRGSFRGGMSYADGAQNVKIKDSKISIFGTAIGTEPDFGTIPMVDCRVVLDNLTVDGAGIQYNGDGNIHPMDGNERVFYFGNGTGLDIRGGYIDGNYRTAISIFGGGDNNLDRGLYRPIVIDGVVFGPRLKRSIQTGAYQKHFLSNMVLRGAFHYRGQHAVLDKVDVDINLNDPTTSNIYTAETNRPIRIEPSSNDYTLTWTNSNLRINGAHQGFIVMDDLNGSPDEPENRFVMFDNVNIYYNHESTPTTNSSEHLIQLGDAVNYYFNNVNIFARTLNNLTDGFILFREARKVFWEDSRVYYRNGDNDATRYFRFDDDGTQNILNEISFDNVTLKGWDGTSYVDDGNFGEFYRMDDSTRVSLSNVNRNAVNINATSDITNKDILKDEVQFNNEGVIVATNYGNGSLEASDLSKTESNYAAVFAIDSTIVEKEIDEFSQVKEFVTPTYVDSVSITPEARKLYTVNASIRSVLITMDESNLEAGDWFYIHALNVTDPTMIIEIQGNDSEDVWNTVTTTTKMSINGLKKIFWDGTRYRL